MNSSPSAIRARRARSMIPRTSSRTTTGTNTRLPPNADDRGRERGDDDDREERLGVDLGQHGRRNRIRRPRRYPRTGWRVAVRGRGGIVALPSSSPAAPAAAGALDARADRPPSRRSSSTRSPTTRRASARWPPTRTVTTASASGAWRIRGDRPALHGRIDLRVRLQHLRLERAEHRRAARRLRAVRRRQGRHDLPAHPPLRCAAATRSASTTSRSGSRWSRRTSAAPTRRARRSSTAGRRRAAAVRLAAWLRTRYRIGSRDLIGHAMANDSPPLQGPRGLAQRPHRLAQGRGQDVPQARDQRRSATASGRPRARAELGSRRLRPQRRGPAGWSRGRIGDPGARAHRPDRRRDPRRRGGRPRGGQAAAPPSRPPARRRRLDRRPRSTPTATPPTPHQRPRRRSESQLQRRLDGRRAARQRLLRRPAPFSEPETKALRRLVRRDRPRRDDLLPPALGRGARCRARARRRCRSSTRGSPASRRPLPRPAPARHGDRWQNQRGGAAFVVELPKSGLSDADVRRHARAAAQVAPAGVRPAACEPDRYARAA